MSKGGERPVDRDSPGCRGAQGALPPRPARDDGTVYDFGETVDIYEGGEVVAHDGSWLVGGPTEPGDPPETATADTPAVFMPALPEVGDSWKPEDLFPVVDETTTMLKADAKVKVPALKSKQAILVRETSEIPDTAPERKWYVPDVGVVKAKAKGEKLVLVASTLLAGPVDPKGP